jgi:hypothetical protein
MYGLTRGALTLVGAAAAGLLLWIAANIVPSDGALSEGGHWAIAGLVAAAGLTMAFSQILGGWTKWGWPRVSGNVFVIAFLPVFVAGGWIVAASEPGEHWLGGHVRSWSGHLGIGGVVGDLTIMFPAIAFGIGLVYGLTFDTTGPRIPKRMRPVAAAGAQPPVATTDGTSEDRRVHIGEGSAPEAPAAEPPPRAGEPTET